MDNTFIYNSTKMAAYFLWEYSKHESALSLWYCAEDIAFYLEEKDYLSLEEVDKILSLQRNDMRYVRFIRNLAYRIFIFTQNPDHIRNWFVAENLTFNKEWLLAIVHMASAYRMIREGKGEDFVGGIKTGKIRTMLHNH